MALLSTAASSLAPFLTPIIAQGCVGTTRQLQGGKTYKTGPAQAAASATAATAREAPATSSTPALDSIAAFSRQWQPSNSMSTALGNNSELFDVWRFLEDSLWHDKISEQAAAAAAKRPPKSSKNYTREKLPPQALFVGLAGLRQDITSLTSGLTVADSSKGIHQVYKTSEQVVRACINAMGEWMDLGDSVNHTHDQYDRMYLGNYPELFGVPWNDRDNSAMRKAIANSPRILEQLGLTREEFECQTAPGTYLYHLDHIVPKSYGGPGHAMNLVVMKGADNQAFGNDITPEKVARVGFHTHCSACRFTAEYLGVSAVYHKNLHLLQVRQALRRLQPAASSTCL